MGKVVLEAATVWENKYSTLPSLFAFFLNHTTCYSTKSSKKSCGNKEYITVNGI